MEMTSNLSFGEITLVAMQKIDWRRVGVEAKRAPRRLQEEFTN